MTGGCVFAWSTGPGSGLLRVLLCFLACLPALSAAGAAETFCPGGSRPDPNVLWCDDFDDGVPPKYKYWEYHRGKESFLLRDGCGLDGSACMRAAWTPGLEEAGNLKVLLGKGPFPARIRPEDHFDEIYWRFYLKMELGWAGHGYKLTRATILADRNRAQAMIAHLWEGTRKGDTLGLDPASGIGADGELATTTYNDFPNLRWLGHRKGVTALFSPEASGRWRCIEAHVKLNSPGASDGVFEFWVDGSLEAASNDLDWVGYWSVYGINAIFLENYWNGGAPGGRVRYFDNFVISKGRIGCGPSTPGDPSP